MDKNYLIQLTNNLYRLTLLFPKKEPLRYKMREVADEILSKCSKANLEQNLILEELETLDGFFEVAKNQNWVPAVELLRIQEEYQRIKTEIKKMVKKSLEEKLSLSEFIKIGSRSEIFETRALEMINIRQKKILEVLKEKKQAQVWQIKEIFPGVTKRTLRRDFENLLKQGIIERIGERNNTFYQLKIRTG